MSSSLPESDRARLAHMLDAARQAVAFGQGRSRAELDTDRMLSFAIVRAVEIVGEAAANIGDETKARLPGIPWTHIVGMRNRLVHAYFSIDADRVWDTLQEDLPALIIELERAAS
jgi:uncharacterized protein with HEPN domain